MIEIDLQGKVALITGATGELGRVMTRTLANAGADIAIHYHRNGANAERLKQELHGLGRRGIAVSADVTNDTSVQAMRDKVARELAPPDIIVNNAVIQYPHRSVLEQPVQDYESQFRSCVLHNVLMAQCFVPAMVERGWGRVIGINTECSMQCWPTQSAYVSGKRGMDGVLRTLAQEVGAKGITVNQVAPGWTVSENVSDADTPEWYLERIALRRRGTDQEVANAVAYLASDLASFITGAFIPVCGGTVMPAI